MMKAFYTLLFLLWFVVPSEATRLFTSGFEENCTTTCKWTSVVGNAPTIGTTAPHSGTYRLNTDSAVGNSYLGYSLPTTTRTSGSTFMRFYFRSNTATPSANTFIYKSLSNAAAETVQVEMLTTGALRLTNAVTSTTVSTSATLSADTWYRVNIRHLLSDTVGEMEVSVYTDAGSLIETISISGEDTLATNIGNFRLGKTGSTAVFSYDDVAWNDSSGSSQTTAPGAGKIYILVPDSDVSVTWENEAAGTATYTKIDDIPGAPDDATTYNTEVVTLNSVDRFGLSNLGAEVPSDATIILAVVQGRVGSNQTSSCDMRWKLWDEASTVTNGPLVDANTNGWVNTRDTELLVYYNTTGKTKSNFDSFNAGYENITDVATRERRVTAMWMDVEWIEAASSSRKGTLLGVYP